MAQSARVHHLLLSLTDRRYSLFYGCYCQLSPGRPTLASCNLSLEDYVVMIFLK